MRTILIIILVSLLLATGCDRYIDSKKPTEPEPVELAAPSNVAATLNDQSVNLTWQFTDSSSTIWFRIYRADSLQGTYTLADSTTEFTHQFDNLVLNRRYYFSLAAVGTNGVEGRRSSVVSALVGPLSIVINDGREFTNNQHVQIQLNSLPGTTHMILSEDSLFADAVYESFAATSFFDLSDGEGVKKIYAGLIFQDGVRTGTSLSDQITLDQRTNIDSVYYSPSGSATVGDTIFFYLATNETGGEASISIEGIAPITLYDDGVAYDLTADDALYSGHLIVNASLVLTDAQFIGTFTDQAGNTEQLSSSVPLNILSTPQPVQLIQTEAISSYEVTLTWSESGDADFASYRIYRSTLATVDNSGQPLYIRPIKSSTTFTDTTVAAETKYFYCVYVYANNGLSAPSNVDSATTLINDPPQSVILAGGIYDAVSIRLSWSTSQALDFESYRIYRDFATMADTSDGTLIEYINTQSTITYTDYAPADTTYYYRVYVFDRQGAFASSEEIAIER